MAGGGYLRTMWRESCAHGIGRRWISVVAVSCATVAASLAGTGNAAAAPSACAEAVLQDWTRAALGSSYAPECYEQALDALPEDLRAYTTAADDITRAAIAAGRTGTTAVASRQLSGEAPVDDPQLGAFPVQVVVLGVVLAAVLAGGGAAALARRRRGEQ